MPDVTVNTAATDAAALAAKAPTASPTFTGTVSGVTKAYVGLGNVDNTTDANKPVSTAQAAALDDKADEAALSAVATSGQYGDLLGRPERLEQTVPYSNGAYPVTDPLALYHYFKGPVTPTQGLGGAREGDLWLKTTAAFPTGA